MCINIPVGAFDAHKINEGETGDGNGAVEPRSGLARIPATILNQYGLPQVYDHDCADLSHRDMIRAIRLLEIFITQKATDEQHRQTCERRIAELRAGMKFLDKIGRLTLVKSREELGR